MTKAKEVVRTHTITIPRYMDAVLAPFPWYDDQKLGAGAPAGWDELDENFLLDSVCGQLARRLIDKTAELLAMMMMDDEREAVIKAVMHEIMVICYG